MKKFLLPLILYVLSASALAQNTNISGTVNRYSKVTAIEYCGNRVIVDSSSPFQVGAQVLLIQMQGATIDINDSSSYGNILNYGSAGNYEIQTIDSILGDTIKFRYQMARSYNPAQSVQLVTIAAYQTATVTGVLGCKPWDGNTGGVLIMQADTVVLNDTIDVTGTGFRGFYDNDSSQLCFGNLTGYFYTDSMHGAIKGEGIVQYPYLFGSGKNANGGGGGDNQNTGGGGGGNFGHGGIGGQIVYRTFSCQGTSPGQGGSGLAYSDSVNKIFMGGGGGCGHGNNSEGTPGTNGAGICIIIANVMIGNGQYIVANGNDQLNIAGSDGAGAGGAGGTVLLDIGQYAGNITVTATGGIGGSLDNDQLTRSCMGPAGGGGGGVLWVSQASVPANITFSAAGGANGINLDLVSTLCAYGATNGAMPGDTGGSLTGLRLAIPGDPYIRLHATVSDDTVLCNDQQLTLYAMGFASDSVSYLWSTGQQAPSISFLATQTGPYMVTVTDRNTCSVIEQVNVTVYIVSPDFSSNAYICSPQNVTLSAQNPGSTAVTYDWSNAQNTPSITFYADSSTSYAVTVYSDSMPSCMAVDTIMVNVGNLTVTYWPLLDTAVCPGNPVMLTAYDSAASGLGYSWNTGATTDDITVYPVTDTTFDVTVSAGAGCSSTHSFVITMDYLGTIISPDTTICPGGSATAIVTVPNVNNPGYLWSNGDTTQQVSISAIAAGTYTVTVSSTNGCTGTASVTIEVDSVQVAASDTTICPGSNAILLASATGIGDITGYQWSTGGFGASITVHPAANAGYTVTATDSLGCRGQDSVAVIVNNNASHMNPQITAVPDSAAEPGDTVQLSVIGQGLESFLWTPGIYLSDSTVQSPLDTPLRATTYCVAVTDSSGCTEVVCKEIGVGVPPAGIAIPDAFTPNGDGKNDTFKIITLNGTVVSSLKIYNRQGELLFDDISGRGWDGTCYGLAQAQATYVCFVTYYQNLYPDRPFFKVGSFDLFR